MFIVWANFLKSERFGMETLYRTKEYDGFTSLKSDRFGMETNLCDKTCARLPPKLKIRPVRYGNISGLSPYVYIWDNA